MRFIRTVFFMYMVTGSTNFLYAAPIPEITILTGALGNTGEKFPDDLIKFWETITISQNNSNVEIAPKIRLLRIDLAEEKELGIPSTNSWFDNLIKPDSRVTLIKAHDYLDHSKINSDFANSQPSNEAQMKDRKEKYQAEIPTVFEILSTKPPLADNQFASVNDLLTTLKKYIEQDSAAGVYPLKYLVYYDLSSPNITIKDPALSVIKDGDASSKPTSKCDSQTDINQGIQYISMAKAKPTAALQKSDLTNAFNVFNNIANSHKIGECCAALMYRGVVRDLLMEFNFARKDLEAAEQCDHKDKNVHYNLACHYAKHSTKANPQLDLALQELENAVVAEFNDCNLILHDPDLANLRQDKNFKDRLQKMLQQHGRYCIIDSH